MPRNEIKYLLDLNQYHWFRDRCKLLFSNDTHNQEGDSYPVLSAYFDTHDLKFLNQKINGEFDHNKIRLRVYANSLLESSFGFIEAKNKKNQEQNKIRIPINYHPKLLSHEEWVHIPHKGIDEILSLGCNIYHALNIYYEREAYEWSYGVEGPVRINFDKNLTVLPKSQLFVNYDILETYRIIPEDQVILEVKTPSGRIPDFIRKDLRSLGLEQQRISKYAEGFHALSTKMKGYEVQL